MPFTKDEFNHLVSIVTPALPAVPNRMYVLSLAFHSESDKQHVVPLEGAAKVYTTNLLAYWLQHSEDDLLSILQVIQESEGGNIARDLGPFVEKLRAATAPAAPAYKLFISYRRKSWDFTHRLAADLKNKINADIFVDYGGVDSSDFERSILSHLRTAHCVLVVVTEHTFSDRIHQPDDWMRKEIAEALRLGKPTVLVAHEGRFPPPANELPLDIRAIAGRQGIEFYPRYWLPAVEELARFIPKAIQNPPEPYIVDTPKQPSPPASLPKDRGEQSPSAGATHGSPLPPTPPPTPDPRRLFDQAGDLEEDGQYAEAIRLYEQLLALNPPYRPEAVKALLQQARELLKHQEAERVAEAERQRIETERAARVQAAQERYSTLEALIKRAKTEATKTTAREAWQAFVADFPEYKTDPNVLTLWEQVEPPPPPAPKIEVPRPTGFTLPLLEWCDIPEGYVTIEKQKILVPAFRMAKYPVTYAQFQAFIDAPDGYKNDEWWQGLAQRDKTPGDQAWKIDKHPRERVNWYESMAFSRWLASKTGLPVTLPTESQWQRAAQGDDGREYPWGNKFDKAKCNTSESGIGKTTPVDQYPKGASPFGVMDMAGNVWEWCLSKWANPYQHPEDNDPAGDAARVLRGGSWGYRLGFARAASRLRYLAGYRLDHWGFRLVVGSPIPSPVSG